MRWSREADRRWTAEDGSRAAIRRNATVASRSWWITVCWEQTFREKFADGFRRLVRSGKLRLEEEWAKLLEPAGTGSVAR